MNPKSSYQVFIAIPFDGAMLPMYERILKDLKGKFQERFNFIYGNNRVIQPTPHLEIDLFKNQNNDLLEQFLFNIKSSDIIVADLTNNNPNVHVELGIAITLNKNIFRVSGRNLTEIGSDIRGYEVNKYSDEKDLREQIDKYLDTFLSVKELPLSEKAGHFYKLDFPQETKIKHEEGKTTIPIVPIVKMRDGALKVKFKFEMVESEIDWFGIYFRYGTPNPWMGGYLLYIRQNGNLELAELPSVKVLLVKQYRRLEYNEEHILQFGVDGDDLVACLNNNLEDCFKIKGLNNQSIGNVAISCYNSAVSFKQVETVVRDTVNFDIFLL